MSSIQNTTSASYAIQWQYFQSVQFSGESSGQSSSGTSATQAFDPFAGLGGDVPPQGDAGPRPPFSLGTMNALIDAQAQSSTSGLSPQQQKVFGELDADGDGKVTGDELKTAFGAGNSDAVNYVMGKLDKDGDGSISTDEFAAGTTRGFGHHHHMHAGPPPSGDAQDPLAQLLSANGASSTSSANSDGTTTTTITYSDGSKVSMTSAAAQSSSNGSGNAPSDSTQQNLLEQLIKMQSQLLQSASATSATSSLATI